MTATPPSCFASFVDAQPTRNVELPLVHSTRCELFRLIASTGILEPQPCPIFGEPLTYLFYGRPVYRSSRYGLQPSTEVTFCPVCLVFRPDAITNIARLYPCDSGGLRRDKFNPPIPSADYLLFELSKTLESARRLTSKFFDSNRAYYHGDALPDPSIPREETQACHYHELIVTEGTSDFDQRRSAIEVQTREQIELRNNVAYVILPAAFLGTPSVRELVVRQWRAEPITYSTYRGGIPVECTNVIIERFRDQLERGGYF